MTNSEILIYQNPDGKINLDVRLEDETVWLSQEHMARLFGKSKKTVTEHIVTYFPRVNWRISGCPEFPDIPRSMGHWR